VRVASVELAEGSDVEVEAGQATPDVAAEVAVETETVPAWVASSEKVDGGVPGRRSNP
jgi:hypothetical protein